MIRAALLVALPVLAAPAYDATDHYAVRKIEGWTVRVNKRLLEEKRRLARATLRLLRIKLYDITRVVPPPALADLRKIPIWVEADSKKVRCACYHVSEDWLRKNGFNPEKAGSMEIGNPETFLDWTHEQPWMVLHELAHGYHHQVLGYDHAELRAAYERALEGKSYESVLRYSGKMQRAYALNNDREYFAELTEAYFGVNDYYPFVRAEIMNHDPEALALLRKAWRDEGGEKEGGASPLGSAKDPRHAAGPEARSRRGKGESRDREDPVSPGRTRTAPPRTSARPGSPGSRPPGRSGCPGR